MICNSTNLRVRYSETDQMGVVNNAQYASFFEIGRTELFRELGISYALMEKEGIMLPVVELYVKYFRSAHYDDVLTIKTTLHELPSIRIRFDYEIFNAGNELITQGHTLLAFINGSSRKPCRPPENIQNILAPYFK